MHGDGYLPSFTAMSKGQILFQGDDQKVIEEVEIDVGEWHFGVGSALHHPLSHGTLVNQKTPAHD